MRRVALALVVAIVLTGCRLETATAPTGSAHFQTQFADAQELSVGHTVRISDVIVGTVVGIELDGYEAVVEYSIVDGQAIPDGTTAAIASTSLLGENYVQLRLPDPIPSSLLPSGSDVPSAGTVATVEELAVQLLALTRAIQGRDLASVVEAGATAIGPRGAELNALISSLGELTGGLAAQSAIFDGLLTDAESLLAVLAPQARDLGDTLDAAARASVTLAAQRDRLVAVVDDLTVLAGSLDREVLAPHRARLERIIEDLAPVTDELVGERERLKRVLERVVVVTERIPQAVHEGGVLAYAWLHNLTIGGQRIDLAPGADSPTGLRSLDQLLLPEKVRGR